MNSLRGRLFIASLIVLAIFALVVFFALERSFRSGLQQAEREKLMGLTYSLLAATEVNDNGELFIEESELREKRLLQANGPLTAAIYDNTGKIVWQAPAGLPEFKQPLVKTTTGNWYFTKLKDRRRQGWFSLSFGLSWELENKEELLFNIVLLEKSKAYQKILGNFRHTLASWSLFGVAFLLLILLSVLRWGLTPLTRLANEIKQMRAGQQKKIGSHYPRELQPLTSSLNELLTHERKQQQRYKNSLSDLAHSLKTPLAVMRGLLEAKGATNENKPFSEQLKRIDQVVSYQLGRAAAAGRQAFLKPLPLRALVERVITAIAKVQHQKAIKFKIDIAEQLQIKMAEADILEILGNLIENAGKWCHQEIIIIAKEAEQQLFLSVIDDGPGFPEQQANQLLNRGARTDSHAAGEGIGLALVNEIISSYNGKIFLKRAENSGAEVQVLIPIR